MPKKNIDIKTVKSFGYEWKRFDQSLLSRTESSQLFKKYFGIFPWHDLPDNPEGFDMGCGSGRWANLVAARVGHLHCIDPSREALEVAKRKLKNAKNVTFHNFGTLDINLPPNSQDFGYSIGVLHHIPDTQKALEDCVRLLKPNAPLLIYLYYRFDNRPYWYRLLWGCSDIGRKIISKLPSKLKIILSDAIALLIYWPLTRASKISEFVGWSAVNIPLYEYRNASFYTMRTDAHDRFATPLEQRFTKEEIRDMMDAAGLDSIEFSEQAPYWCAIGKRKCML